MASKGGGEGAREDSGKDVDAHTGLRDEVNRSEGSRKEQKREMIRFGITMPYSAGNNRPRGWADPGDHSAKRRAKG